MSSPEEGATVEGRVQRRRRGSPGQSSVAVTVVYYLCRSGRHLEHPHLMEMHLASPNHALYLRDVIRRLDALRGKGMATMYSWSCKRRYKTGFVWHDVLEDDMLLPAQGSEYVLKGSLLLPRQSSPPALVAAPPPADHGHTNVSTNIIRKVHCVKPTPDEGAPTHCREGWTTNSSLSSPPTIEPEVEEPPPPPVLHQEPQPELSSLSPSSCCTTGDRDEEAASARSSSSGSPSSPNKPTRGSAGRTPSPSGSTSSTTPPSLMLNNKEQASTITAQGEATQTQGTPTGRDLHKKDAGCSTGSTLTKATVPTDDRQPGRTRSFSSSTRSGTLESLIRAEALGRRGATAKRILEDEDDDDDKAVQSLGTKLNPANLLMRLVACGSTMSARQNLPACGLMRTTHKPQYSSQHVELLPSSPVLSPLGALIMRPVTAAGARVISDSGDCSHCSESMLQTAGKGCESGKMIPKNIKPSSSYGQDCVSEKEASVRNLDNLEGRHKIISQTIKMSPYQQPTSGTLVTITTDVRHNNGEQECSNEASSKTLSRSTSKRMTDRSPRSSRAVSFHDEKEKVVKIEERSVILSIFAVCQAVYSFLCFLMRYGPCFNHCRLASGACVIIQCTPLLKETYASAKAM
ncbi:unnamed protein product [Urochloa decumbens]|uniref:SOSEKI DIX-like domain-containing protein n=1 Tax=Urochloa decumbens TaxID=240449 RepID=A0ABC9G9H2_9POAL